MAISSPSNDFLKFYTAKLYGLTGMLKGTPSKVSSWIENVENRQKFPLGRVMNQKYPLALSLSFSGCSHVGSLFTNEEQKSGAS